jgi:hypothetical protein
MKTNTHVWSYPAQFFLEWEMFQMKLVQKIKKHILRSITFFFSKIEPLIRHCGKIPYSRAGHRWHYGANALYAGYLRLQTHAQNI